MKFRTLAALAAKQPLTPFEYELPPLAPGEVDIRVTHCGICHSDTSMINNEWGFSAYPLVPGHEVIGVVEAVGPGPSDRQVGQRVGLGWQAGSCGHCEYCRAGKETFCDSESDTIIGRHGGFADRVRAQDRFLIPIPDAIASESAGPLMCAGTTVFTPMLHFGVRPTMKTAVVGVGGLGHLAIQFLAAFGCHVTAVSNTRSKESESRQLGADDFIATSEAGSLKAAAKRFDYVISTAPGQLNWDEVVGSLRPEGRLVVVGVAGEKIAVPIVPMIMAERSVSGGRTGAPGDLARMLAFAAQHKIKPMIKTFPFADVNKAVAEVNAGTVRYRAVLVM
jgi:uncharacterized zinc-type alcohol dehydrogenase-like protein